MSKKPEYLAKREAALRAKGKVTPSMRSEAASAVNAMALAAAAVHERELAVVLTAAIDTAMAPRSASSEAAMAIIEAQEKHFAAIEALLGIEINRLRCLFPGCDGLYVSELDETWWLNVEGFGGGPVATGWVYPSEPVGGLGVPAHTCTFENDPA